MRKDTACSCDLRPYILVTACRLRTSDFAMTLTASCSKQQSDRQEDTVRKANGWARQRALSQAACAESQAACAERQHALRARQRALSQAACAERGS